MTVTCFPEPCSATSDDPDGSGWTRFEIEGAAGVTEAWFCPACLPGLLAILHAHHN